MATMSRIQKIEFFRRNGFDCFEAIWMSFKSFSRSVLVGLKKLRIENEQRKKYQETIRKVA